jgi:hypothetical protein
LVPATDTKSTGTPLSGPQALLTVAVTFAATLNGTV